MIRLSIALLFAAAAAGCVITVERDYSGEWSVIESAPPSNEQKMASCMQFASQSYCEREVWGGR